MNDRAALYRNRFSEADLLYLKIPLA